MAEETYFDKISSLHRLKLVMNHLLGIVTVLRNFGTPSVPELLRSGKLNKTPHPKHLNMFVYAPKFAKKLPYYDTFPLVMYLKSAEGGFYGLNFHYLPYALRARLLDAAGQDELDVSAVENSRLTKPTIKRYLYGYARSMFRKIDSEDNLTAIMLPVQRFKKLVKTKSGVTQGR